MAENRISSHPNVAAGAAERLTGDAAGRLASLCDRFGPRLAELRSARRERRSGLDPAALPPLAAVSSVAAGSAVELPAPLRKRTAELHPMPVAASLEQALASDATGVVVDLAAVLPSAAAVTRLHAWLGEQLPVQGPRLIVGPRAIDRDDESILVDGEPAPAVLVDVALLLRPDGDLHLRLGHLDSAAEAAFMAEVLDGPQGGAARPWVTIGIDTVAAALAAPAILAELRRHAVALTTDRAAWLHDFLRCFRANARCILPDSDELTGAVHFLHSFGLRLVQLAHRTGIAALAPPLPVLPLAGDRDPALIAALRSDIERDVRDGFDGSAVVHPDLIGEVAEIYRHLAPRGDQRHRERADVRVTTADLLQVPAGKITQRGLRRALREALTGWLAVQQGVAALDLDGRRVTASAVALAADQLRLWVHHDTGVLDDGRIVDAQLFRASLDAAAGELDAADDTLRDASAALAAHVLDAGEPGRFP